MRKIIRFLLILLLTAGMISASVSAEADRKLSISVPYPGRVLLEGDITAGERVRLFLREYRSSNGVISDKLLVDTAAEADGPMTLSYGIYAVPLSEELITPDFTYAGSEIMIRGVYAVLGEGPGAVRSALFYTDCYLDTGVVNQYWSSPAGATACGTAAGIIAMQMVYPVSGTDLVTRLNTMREYCTEGDEFSAGPPEYYLAGEHITNAVNRYILEDLGSLSLLTDHRTPDQTTEETLIGLLSTGRPAVIEVCYLLGTVTRECAGVSHWITVNGFALDESGITFRYSDPITVSYKGISSELLGVSNGNVTYGDSPYVPNRYIGAFSEPLLSIEHQLSQ